MKTIYAASATAASGRSGRVFSHDPELDLRLSVPKEMGGNGGEGTNPEQLFAAGYAACFSSAVALVAKRKGMAARDFEITAQVGLGRDEDVNYGLEVELTGRFPGLESASAEALMHEAHTVCPYSRAMRGNVEVALKVEG